MFMSEVQNHHWLLELIVLVNAGLRPGTGHTDNLRSWVQITARVIL